MEVEFIELTRSTVAGIAAVRRAAQGPAPRRAELEVTSRILILDYGSQFTQLIARRIRERGCIPEIHPPTRSPRMDPGLEADR